MISENVIILGFLCVLCVRGRLVRRGWALVTAILFWSLARLLMELSFKGGSYEYSWGSLPSLVAIGCLSLSVLLIYVACVGQDTRPAIGAAEPAPAAKEPEPPPPASDPSERIREILITKDQG